MAHSLKKPQHAKRRRQNSSEDLSSDSEDEARVTSGHWAAWLVVEAVDASRPLSALSPFAVQKGFSGLAGPLKTVKRLRNGTFLVECQSKKQSEKLTKATTFVDRPVKVSPHKGLNSSKGVIRCPDLKGVSEVEIRDELKSQGVVEVRRAMFRKDGNLVPTNTIFLTFCTPDLPQAIKVGYLRVKVALYVPSPLRCFKCQKFGHVRDRCPGEEMCGACAQAAHDGPCRNPVRCANCKGEHPSSSRDCPVWKTEEAIQRVKTENKISFFEARKLVTPNDQTMKTFAEAVKSKEVRSMGCQTDLSCFGDDIPGLKITPKPTKEKSVNIQTDMKNIAKSPASQGVNPLIPELVKAADERGNKPSTPSAKSDGLRSGGNGKSGSPTARPAGGGARGESSGRTPVVVDTFRPPPKPAKPPKPVLKKDQRSSLGWSFKKTDIKLTNKFSLLESKEEHDANVEMDNIDTS